MAEYGNMVRRVSSFTQCKKEVSEETTLKFWISLIWMIKNWLGQLVDWLLDESGWARPHLALRFSLSPEG